MAGGLFSGLTPNLLRWSVVGATELVGYFHAKQQLLRSAGWADGTHTHAAASVIAGLAATLLGSPMDALGTRMMQRQPSSAAGGGGGGVSTAQYALRMLRTEGVASFYKGFGLNWSRTGSFNLLLFVTYEALRKRLDARLKT